MTDESGHPDIPSSPAPGFLLANKRTESTFEEIPVIDFTDATSTDPVKRRALADLILDASVNERIAAALEAGKRFFALDMSAKMELDISKTSNFKGYTALLQENVNPSGLGDLHEGSSFGLLVRSHPFLNWRPSASRLTWRHSDDAIRLGKLLFPLFALALELSDDFFDDKITRPAAIMRLLHYPPQPLSVDVEGRQIGIVGGLQVKNAAGKWLDAVHIPGTLVVNLGDQFARWTNDVFQSTPHRAINRSGQERYSIPVFFGTDYDVLLEPIPTCISPEMPAKYEVITAGAYVKSRLDATYGSHVS
ncbi:hypothetical protein FPV67DRAFT_1559926 [Lyophyllum atratum]|nr:hypothetical protein FPV67DRAFT_1559926 [Lyophyllum atratum]